MNTSAATDAAEQSGVTIRTVEDLASLQAVIDLFSAVWPSSGPPPLSLEHLRALAYAGNYVGVAYGGDTLLGATVGFFGSPPGQVLHSDVTGVSSAAAGRSVGLALKLYQREWALGPARFAGDGSARSSLLEDVDGVPVGHEPPDAAALVRIAVPVDIEVLRASDPDLARQWRHQVRATLGEQLAAGGEVTAFVRGVGYGVRRS